MEVVFDPDVKAVAEFMQANVPAAKLMGVANRISEIAGLLWGHYDADDVEAMRLVHPPMKDHGSQTQSGAIE